MLLIVGCVCACKLKLNRATKLKIYMICTEEQHILYVLYMYEVCLLDTRKT
jgi:hypothetical protein